jgi:hypothetical protein
MKTKTETGACLANGAATFVADPAPNLSQTTD